MYARISETQRINKLARMGSRLPEILVSRVWRSMTSQERITLSNMFRPQPGPRRLTDAEIAARLTARGIDPKYMPTSV